jgi:hypothetical protein
VTEGPWASLDALRKEKFLASARNCTLVCSTHSLVTKLNKLHRIMWIMQYRKIIAASSEIHAKHINALRGQNAKFLIVKHGSTYSNQRANYQIGTVQHIRAPAATKTITTFR